VAQLIFCATMRIMENTFYHALDILERATRSTAEWLFDAWIGGVVDTRSSLAAVEDYLESLESQLYRMQLSFSR